MSKSLEIVQQVHEIPRFTTHESINRSNRTRFVLIGILLFTCLTWITACGGDGRSARTLAPLGDFGSPGSTRLLRRGLPGDSQTLDPQLADDTYSFQVIRDLYEGLTAENRIGEIVPGVASSWTVDKSGTTYTFHLRATAKWSDGTRVVANDFVAGLKRAVDPSTASGSADLLSVIKGATAITGGRKEVGTLGVIALSDSAIQIELEHPAPYLLQILSQPIAAPVHPKSPESSASSSEVTNGPYMVASRVAGSFIELVRNPQYWDIANVAIDRVRYVNVESGATELHEYEAGQLDMTFTIPMSDFKRISDKFGAEVQKAPILGTQYLDLNLREPPLRASRDLRQALSMAVDREEIAKHVMTAVDPAYALVAEGISGYLSPVYEWSGWTRERQLGLAKQLYANAGFTAKKPLHLRLYFNRDEGIQRVMTAIAGSWKQNLGVETELVSDEFRVFLIGRKDWRRWDVTRLGWNADYDDPASFLNVFAIGNGENDAGYDSPLFNDLINNARLEANHDKRFDLLRRSEQVLLGDYPIIPIYFYTARRLVKPYVGGATLTPMNHTYTKHLFWKPS
jgi:oligopeptide transport system substrate-binding protein